MAFTDITIAQRNSDYTNVTDPSAKLVSLNRDGDAVLEISTATAEFIVQNLSLHAGKPVIISTGSTYFLAGNYVAQKLECSLVRIVEAANVPETMPA
ncbi:hypothetical protein [Citrobacter phage vB_CfrS_K1M]